MTSEFNVRTLATSDAPSVISLWNKVLPASQPWNEPLGALRRKRDHLDDLVFVAQSEEEIVGAVMAGYDGVRGWIYSLAVLPEFRRRGIGRALVEHAEKSLAQLGCLKINLQVRSDNGEVIAFYERLGFLTEDRISLGKPVSCGRDSNSEKISSIGLSGEKGPALSKTNGSIDGEPTKEEIRFVDDQLEDFNAQKTGRDDKRTVNLAIRNDDQDIVAGLNGLTTLDWLYIGTLWVHPQHRRRGLGTQLLLHAETIANQRGCIGACLTSFSFQSPEFYRRHGYETCGAIEDYPIGESLGFYCKRFE